MACLKCGSSWTTRKGKDMVSCPECCRQQRVKARKQGRLPSSQTKSCKRCGQSFEAIGGNAILRVVHCAVCGPVVRSEYLARRKAEIASGARAAKPTPTRPDRACLQCGKRLNKNQAKYCGNDCFSAAKHSGTQTWDRTAQLQSVWHRGGRWACAPSRKPMQEMMLNMGIFLARVRRLYAKASEPQPCCKVCGCIIERNRKGYCSITCMKQHVVDVACRKCGKPAKASGGRKTAVCQECRRKSQRLAKDRHGKNHRKRARYHGVKYMSFHVRSIYERDNYTCQLCGKAVLHKAAYRKRDGKIHPRSPTIDHIVAMANGGNHEPSNCQTACFICNSRKSNKGGGQLRLALA